MLLGSPPDMVHRAPAHGAHIRMQNSAIYSPVPFSMPQNILQGVVALYRALYRKWRPRKFADVVGQEAIVTALQNQIAAGRIGHAYLFTGIEKGTRPARGVPRGCAALHTNAD